LNEAAQLITQMQDYSSSAGTILRSHQEEIANLQRTFEAMKTPWLNSADALRSVRGFAELQGIGQALRSAPAFDVHLTNSLRLQLGDWQQAIKWPESIFTNPIARTEFYIEHGLNPALTDFPSLAFNEGAILAGLKNHSDVYVSEGGTSSSENDDQEQGFTRTNAAHDHLQRFEHKVRRFIERRMTETFGPNWITHQVPGDKLTAWREKKQKAMDNGAPDLPLIDYADFTDYVPLITRRDNWQKIFKQIFRRETFVQESFQRLYPIRITTMHARIITQDDELYLYVETKRILGAIGDEY
jgi:hypothetical protein